MRTLTCKKVYKMTALALVLFLCLALVSGCFFEKRTRVQWRDPAVGEAVAAALDKEDANKIYFDELEKITSLTLTGNRRVDITDVAGLPNLESLDVSDVQVNDFSPLLSSTTLKKLTVGEMDYGPHLEILELLQSRIEHNDIDVDMHYWAKIRVSFQDHKMEELIRTALERPTGPLSMADTRRVTKLSADGIVFETLEDLRNCTQLRELTLKNAELTSLGCIPSLTNIQYLNVSGNNITDISVLSRLEGLRVLSLEDNAITDVSVLQRFPQLRQLLLSGNKIEDFSPLSEMTELQMLTLSDSGLSDIAFLEKLTKLQMLDLGENEISDITPLGGMTSLEMLILHKNRITDISALSEMKKMTNLVLQANNIRDISPLSGMGEMEELLLLMNNITDISPIVGMERLHTLSLLSNPVMDYRPLADWNHDFELTDVDFEKAAEATDKARGVAAELDADDIDDEERVRRVHEYVIHNTVYDHESVETNNLGFHTQSLYAAIIEGKAVCVGYAEAMAVMLMHMDIPCRVVSGVGGGGEHAWNILKLEEGIVYVDATWDDYDVGYMTHTGFLLVGEDVMREDHSWDEELFARLMKEKY